MILMFEAEEQPRLPRLRRFTGDFPSLQNLALIDESNDKSTLKLAPMLGLRSRPFFADSTIW